MQKPTEKVRISKVLNRDIEEKIRELKIEIEELKSKKK